MGRETEKPRPTRGPRRKIAPRKALRSRKVREAALEAAAFKEMIREHWLVPAMGLLSVFVIGATRFEESRAMLANVIALGTPVLAMAVGVAPMRESHSTFRALAFSVAALIAIGAELLLVPVIVSGQPSPALELVRAATTRPELPVVLVVAALCTVPLEAVAVKRGVGSRFAALTGVTVGLALYLPAYFTAKDPFGSVLVAFLVALFVGGGAGFVLGLLARAATGSRV